MMMTMISVEDNMNALNVLTAFSPGVTARWVKSPKANLWGKQLKQIFTDQMSFLSPNKNVSVRLSITLGRKCTLYAGCVSCCPLVSYVDYAPRALLRLKKDGTGRQTDRRTDARPLHYAHR